MMHTITVIDLKKHLDKHLKDVIDNSTPLLVRTDDTDDVVILSIKDYDALVETIKISTNTQLIRKIKRGDAQINATISSNTSN